MGVIGYRGNLSGPVPHDLQPYGTPDITCTTVFFVFQIFIYSLLDAAKLQAVLMNEMSCGTM